MNAKPELMEHVDNREVEYVHVVYQPTFDRKDDIEIKGTLEEVLPKLDFVYSDGYGTQNLHGTIWYKDGTWSRRDEYDGSEWWSYYKCPVLPAGKKLSEPKKELLTIDEIKAALQKVIDANEYAKGGMLYQTCEFSFLQGLVVGEPRYLNERPALLLCLSSGRSIFTL